MRKPKIIGYVAVDSGQILLVDPCYLSSWNDGEYRPGQEPNNHYAKACELSQSPNLGGQMIVSGIAGTAVVAESGWGDGLYPVRAVYGPDDRIKKLEIEFYD